MGDQVIPSFPTTLATELALGNGVGVEPANEGMQDARKEGLQRGTLILNEGLRV